MQTSSAWADDDAVVFEDQASRVLLAHLERVAPSETTVLIEGETGTGKEVVARYIHRRSRRSLRPFVAVNCGALSPTLIESELFGHERGAFSGALVSRAGWFEEANGGTLFLDEIGELPLPSQATLLRVLQEREVVRVGSRRQIPLDFRLLAATNVDLEGAVTGGRFRRDLFYRLAVTTLLLPPLRNRPGDILPLARRFLAAHAGSSRDGGPRAPRLSAAAEQELRARRWPGNVRELENALQHALLVSRGDEISPEDLPVLPAAHPEPTESALPLSGPTSPLELLRSVLARLFDERPPRLWAQIEDTVIRSAFEHQARNQVRTARLLGIGRNVVRAKLSALGLLSRSPAAPP